MNENGLQVVTRHIHSSRFTLFSVTHTFFLPCYRLETWQQSALDSKIHEVSSHACFMHYDIPEHGTAPVPQDSNSVY